MKFDCIFIKIVYCCKICAEKPKICLDLVLKIRTIQKFDIHSEGFATETACNLQFKLKVTKITLLAFSVEMKNVL